MLNVCWASWLICDSYSFFCCNTRIARCCIACYDNVSVHRSNKAGEGGARLSWPIPHLAHLLFVPYELAIELLDLDFDGCYTCICLQGVSQWIRAVAGPPHGIDGILERWLGFLASRCAKYPVHDG